MVSAGARLLIERSGFGTLCCVLGQDTLFSQCLSPTGVQICTSEVNAGGNSAVD